MGQIRLGGELELNNVEVKESVLKARKVFLKLIDEMKPDVISDLICLVNYAEIPANFKDSNEAINLLDKVFLYHFVEPMLFQTDLTKCGIPESVRDTPLLNFCEYFHQKSGELERLKVEVENGYADMSPPPSSQTILSKAIYKLIPDWNLLQTDEKAGKLCASLKKWSERWNLEADWCLDFALKVLVTTKIYEMRQLSLKDKTPETCHIDQVSIFHRHVNNGKAWIHSAHNYDSVDIYSAFELDWKISKGFSFKWEDLEISFSWLPKTDTKPEFKERAEKEFWNRFLEKFGKKPESFFVGKTKKIADCIADFDKKLDAYIADVLEKYGKYTSKTPKKESDQHFRWFIEYQIPECKYYSQIASRNNVNENTVRLAVKDIGELIGINQHKGKKSGRPKDIKESRERINPSNW